jgi:catechol 2,3-dioxygenase-like lactoylglutathione lyase family enzyme
MMKRTGTPWMPAADYGRSLSGIGHNMLVSDIAAMTAFLQRVMQASIVYEDADFAVANVSSGSLILHADHTYNDHPFVASVADADARGAGLEIRLYDVDPDAAEAAAQANDYDVLDGSTNKPHGLREAYVLGPDGYCFVPSRPLSSAEA